MDDKIYTVTEFNKLTKNIIDDTPLFHNFFLKGELSGVTYYRSGHLYFTLKDSRSQIKCAAFNFKLKKIPTDLKEGDSVTIFGDVGFYEARGDFQILVRHIEKEDELGVMYKKLEEVKKKMEDLGYFSNLYKKQLPFYPQNIGVVTSSHGAGLHDIIATAKKRMDNINIYIYPAKVQGEGASKEIIEGIKTLDKIPEIDLIIAGRGGGSIEDLWSFNEEEVAMAFYNCNKPIISAVGHEIDFLLTDLVADIRAATPTQSIEISIPVKNDVLNILEEKKRYLKTLVNDKLNSSKYELGLKEQSLSLKTMLKYTSDLKEELNYKEINLEKNLKYLLEQKKQKLHLETEKLIRLNPLNTLARGYSIVEKDGQIIKSSKEIKIGDEVNIILKEGNVTSIIKEINK